MDNIGSKLLSAPKNIFVLYLILSGNFLANLFGCRAQQALSNTMWLKHILGFMTMYFFVVLVDSSSKTVNKPHVQLVFAFFCYTLFLLSTRMDYKWWVALILMLAVYYILQVYKEHESTEEKDKQKYNLAQTILTYIASAVLVLGFVIYIGKKKAEYKGKFDWLTFILGKPSCAFSKKDVSMSDYKALLNAFK